ncbi:MAG: hypothetical protein ACD_79C00436G0003 [uncultured bacterium]|nr:MAG: hypothetical protein ACD_79C00436G0003 [uncultured bacterium]
MVVKLIENSAFKDSIEYFGKINSLKKAELLQKNHVLVVTSIKEWGGESGY